MEHNLFLHSKCEGLICAFFKAIGARKSGERLQMELEQDCRGNRALPGRYSASGKEKDGTEKESNDISKFLPAEEVTRGTRSDTSSEHGARSGSSCGRGCR